MNEFVTNLSELFAGYLPKLLTAIGVLVVGWLVALIVAAIVRAVLKRTKIDTRVAAWARGGRPEEGPQVEILAGKLVFWVLMIFVLVAFFSVLGLTPVTTPLNEFLNEVFTFLPRLLSAGFLLLIAWLLASGLRFAVSRGLAATRLDERLGTEVGVEEGRATPSKTLGDTVYWLVFLLFLPAVLDALALEGLLGPVNELLNKVLAFLPNLFVALVILGVGWLMARIIQRIVANLLSAVGTDSLAQRIRLDRVLGERRLSNLLSLVVYVLVLVPVVIAALDALRLEAVTAPASEMLNRMLAAVPQIFAAALVLFVAYLVARLVSELVARLLAGVGFDAALERIGLGQKGPGAPAESSVTSPRRGSDLVGLVVLVAVLLFATIEALRLLQFAALADIVTQFTVFAGDVLLGVLIFGIGLYLAALTAGAIRSSGTRNAVVLSTVARAAILVLAGAMALRQAGLAEDIINMAFGLLLGAIAVAAAIAFGIGGRDLAGRHLESWIDSFKRQS